jgi:hypothetical protein
MRIDVGEEALVHARGDLLEGHLLGNGDKALSRDQRVRGVGAAPKGHAGSHLAIGDLGTQGLNDSYSLASHRRRKVRLVATNAMVEGLADEFAAAFLDIEKIDAGGLDADESFSRAGNRRGQFFQLHDVRAAVSLDANGAHGLYPSPCLASVRTLRIMPSLTTASVDLFRRKRRALKSDRRVPSSLGGTSRGTPRGKFRAGKPAGAINRGGEVGFLGAR